MVWWVGRQETEDGQVQEWEYGSEGQTSLVTSGKADLKLDHVWEGNPLQALTKPLNPQG